MYNRLYLVLGRRHRRISLGLAEDRVDLGRGFGKLSRVLLLARVMFGLHLRGVFWGNPYYNNSACQIWRRGMK